MQETRKTVREVDNKTSEEQVEAEFMRVDAMPDGPENGAAMQKLVTDDPCS